MQAKAIAMPDATPHAFAAVLTGDIRGSRTMGEASLRTAMEVIEQTAHDIGDDLKFEVRFDRHRGDGWQIVLPRAQSALRAALRISAALTAQEGGLQTRIAIGLGTATIPANGDLGAASGTAFVEAGDILDTMERHETIVIDRQVGTVVNAMIGLLDWQAQNWTAPQAAALVEALRHRAPTQEEIATRFGVTRQAIQLRLSGTGLPAIREAIHAFESHIRALPEQAHP